MTADLFDRQPDSPQDRQPDSPRQTLARDWHPEPGEVLNRLTRRKATGANDDPRFMKQVS